MTIVAPNQQKNRRKTTVLKSSTNYLTNTKIKRDVTRKITAAADVIFDKIASIVLPLFLPKNVSAPPAIEPDKPAVLPDCIKTIAISAIATIMCKITIAIIYKFLLNNKSLKVLYHNKNNNASKILFF